MMGDVIPVFDNKYLRHKEPFTAGGYGRVYLGYTNIKQTKVVFKEPLNRSNDNAMREIKILSKINHANIVKLLDWDYHDKTFWMVLEYCNGGDLYKQCTKTKPTVRLTISVIRQAATGLLHLHSMSPPIIHRDIQPKNILIHGGEQDTIVKLCDFGLSKIANEEESTDTWFVSKVIGTLLFRAPEMTTKQAPYTTSLDTFSLGLCLESMYHYGQGKSVEFLPVRAYPPENRAYRSFGEYLNAVKTSCSIVQIHSNDEEIHRKIKELIDEMTQYDFRKRPNMRNVIDKLNQLPIGTTSGSTLILSPYHLPTRDGTTSGSTLISSPYHLPTRDRTYFDHRIEGHQIRLQNGGTQNQMPGSDRCNCQQCCSVLRSQCDECCTNCGNFFSVCCGCCWDGAVRVCQGCCGKAGLIGVGIAYGLTFILLTSLGMWLATDDGYNCELSTGTSDIKIIALVTSMLGFTVPIAPLVAACCGGAEVGGVIGTLAFFAHLGMTLYGMDSGCKAWSRGTCEDRIVEFMCTSGAVLGFLAVIVIVSGIIAACRGHC